MGKTSTKTCPYCGKEIKSIAIKCQHCLKFLDKEQKKTKVCPFCLNEIDLNAQECSFCGENLIKKRKIFSKIRKFIGLIGILGIGLISIHYFYNTDIPQGTSHEENDIKTINTEKEDSDFEKREKCFKFQKEVCDYLSKGYNGTWTICEVFYSKILDSCLVTWDWDPDFGEGPHRYYITDFLQGYKDIYSCSQIKDDEDWRSTDSEGYSGYSMFPRCSTIIHQKQENLL